MRDSSSPLLRFTLCIVVVLVTFHATRDTKGLMIPEITPQDLKTRLDQGESIMLLDVREPEEVALVRLPDAVHIPMGEIPGRLHDIDPDKEIVVYCHHGVRSTRVAMFLAQRDFMQVKNLAGGIDAWALDVAPGMIRY